jgi:hypothetical protein
VECVVAQCPHSGPAALPQCRGFNGEVRVVMTSFLVRLEKPGLPNVRRGKGPRRWKNRRAEPRALRSCRHGWRRNCSLCRRPLRSQNRPRIGRGRDVARVRGAARCIGAPPANLFTQRDPGL